MVLYSNTVKSFHVLVNNSSASHANPDLSEPSMSLNFSTEARDVLNCLTIITRSMHNCKVFSYYGGVQKVTALLKGTLVLCQSAV